MHLSEFPAQAIGYRLRLLPGEDGLAVRVPAKNAFHHPAVSIRYHQLRDIHFIELTKRAEGGSLRRSVIGFSPPAGMPWRTVITTSRA
jgi:hypothetical protein